MEKTKSTVKCERENKQHSLIHSDTLIGKGRACLCSSSLINSTLPFFFLRKMAIVESKDLWRQEPDVFSRGGSRREQDGDDEEALLWAAIERLPTYNRVGRSVVKQVLHDGTVKAAPVDVKNLSMEDWRHLRSTLLHAVDEEQHERFLRRQRTRADRSSLSFLILCLCVFLIVVGPLYDFFILF